MVEMRQKIAVLTETAQHLLSPIEGSNGSTDSQIDDSFDASHRRRAHSHGFDSKWNDTVKELEIPEFRGSYNSNVFNEWLKTIESHLECYDVPKARIVKLVSQSLKGRAFNWWKQLQVGRQRKGQKKVREWRKMRKKLKEHFLPSNHVPHLLVMKQQKKGISSSRQRYQSGFAVGQPSYDYVQVGYSTSVGVQVTFDDHKMLFSDEVVKPRYDEEKASNFGEEDMEKNRG